VLSPLRGGSLGHEFRVFALLTHGYMLSLLRSYLAWQQHSGEVYSTLNRSFGAN